MSHILHLAPAKYFQAIPPDRPYLPIDYERERLVHCTQHAELLLQVANAFYKDMAGDFVVLVIDEDRLGAPVKYEPAAPVSGGEPIPGNATLFPHVYGPINRDAIVDVVGVRRDAQGAFTGYARELD
jgi:uncharacterized protein (DUF952 family)